MKRKTTCPFCGLTLLLDDERRMSFHLEPTCEKYLELVRSTNGTRPWVGGVQTR